MASLALEDIWDAPIVPSPPRSPPRISPPASDDDDSLAEEAPRPSAQYVSRAAPPRPDIDALFDDIDDEPEQQFQDLAPSLDLDALRREADARNAKARPLDLGIPDSTPADGADDFGTEITGTTGSKKGKDGVKERKKPSRLDEARLLGPDGLPALVKQAKHFKPKGKGHEATDLNTLLQVYQFWTHKMYPKNQFRDSVQRVEKLCHSRRMHVSLSVWRDESKGLINGRKRATDSTSDADGSDDDDGSADEAAKQPPPAASDAIPSSRAPSRPPSSASEHTSMDGPDDFDMDAIIREDEARQATEAAPRAAPPPSAPQQSASATNTADDDDEAMWDQLMGGVPDHPAPPPMPGSREHVGHSTRPQDEDDDMWDIVREMEAEPSAAHPTSEAPQDASARLDIKTSSAPTSVPAPPPPPPPAGDDDEWDDMYL
ncbi:replication fork protection component Swi3-domain-containing protein [Amylocystis lapponica]|nr:replication fork protection component Swi3-domain-containing protein [Amylocystis lapponica]